MTNFCALACMCNFSLNFLIFRIILYGILLIILSAKITSSRGLIGIELSFEGVTKFNILVNI